MGDLKDIEILIPNLGDAEETEIIELSVKVGDKVKVNDPLIVLESEKAAMEVPSDFNGVVKEFFVRQGDSVKEGMKFAVIEAENANAPEVKKDKKQPLVSQAETSVKENSVKPEPRNAIQKSQLFAGPAVRKICRELEIDLTKITGTGKNGMITKDDLKTYIKKSKNFDFKFASADDLKQFGELELVSQTKIQKLTAANLHNSWLTIPHVSHFEEIDISLLEKKRKDTNQKSGMKLTPLAYIVSALSHALKEFPIFNSSLVGEGEIALRKNINIGIAVSIDQGLVVPVIKNADTQSVDDISNKIKNLANKAQNKKLTKAELQGASFTISSLGQIGGVGFTPIINPPEVGIIGVSRSYKRLALENEKIVEKITLPVSLSYDHRVINGADAGNFMTYLKNYLEKNI